MYRAIAYIWFSLVGAVACGIAAFLSLWALGSLFWMPYWRELSARKMYVHDIELTYMILLGPFFIGTLFLASTAMSLIAMTILRDRRGRTIIVYLLNALPAIVTLAVINPHLMTGTVNSYGWRYPLSEVAVLAIGLCWALLLLKLAAAATDG